MQRAVAYGPHASRIARSIAALFLLGSAPLLAQAPRVYTVDATTDGADANTADDLCDDGSGACTLRAAIEQANASAGLDSIHFDIPGAGVHTIQPGTLPFVTDPVVIDGYTQPGATPNSNGPRLGSNAVILIEIDASLTSGAGLEISGGASTVRGLSIHSAPDVVLVLLTNGGNRITGNFLGPNAAGDAIPCCVYYGIDVLSSQNTIGGTAPADRNVIGVGVVGIGIEPDADRTVVVGNLIGTDATGTLDLASGGTGIDVLAADSTVIGGASAAAGNVIAGMTRGIEVNTGATRTLIRGNYVGIDVTGTTAIGIGSDGISLRAGSSGTTVGGSQAGEGNVIAGAADPGIRIEASENTIQGNRIGTDASGTSALPNDYEGIYLEEASDNLIGGTTQGAGNTVANSGTIGIAVVGAGSTGNTIARNSLFANPIGIDLGYDGVTANDADDVDVGPNGLVNFPDLAVAIAGSTAAAVQGSYDGAPGGAFTLEFFASESCNALGYGEGERFLGSTIVNTGGSGQTTFTASLTGLPAPGEAVTATATSAQGSTSEFSACVTASGFTIAAAPDTVSLTSGQSASFTVSVAANGPSFDQPVTLSCAGALPAGSSCAFSPSQVTPGTGTATSTLTVGTGAASVVIFDAPRPSDWGMPLPSVLGMAAFAAALLLLAGGRRRVATTAFAVGCLLAPTACSDDPVSPPGPVSSSFSIAGTSGPVTEATEVTVIVE
jgi:hypothetical protein